MTMIQEQKVGYLNRGQMHFYQGEGVNFIIDNPRCCTWFEPGLGKTITTLTAVVDLFDDFEIYRVLVVGPLRVVRKTWPDEIRAWSHTKKLRYTVIDGTAAEREKLALRDTAIHLISRDLLHWLVDFWNGDMPYDMVVLDEASSFRNHTSRRTKAAKIVCSQMKRVVQLTGTPAPNGLHQVWSQIYLLDNGARLGHTFTDFKSRWFDYDPYAQRLTPKGHAERVIHERLKDICFTLKSEDYLELPELISRNVLVEMDDAQKQTYKKLQKDAVLQMEGTDLAAFNAAALAQKLLQYANGAVYLETGQYQVFHEGKTEALRDIVDEAAGEPVLVVYNYKSDLERLKKAFPAGVKIDSDDSINRWNAGQLEVAFIHPKSGGMGLNLQAGGRIIVWFGLTWDLEDYEQMKKRLHRQGQTKPVIMHHLVTAGTIDETVVAVLPQKAAVQNRLLDAMKRHVEEVLTSTDS